VRVDITSGAGALACASLQIFISIERDGGQTETEWRPIYQTGMRVLQVFDAENLFLATGAGLPISIGQSGALPHLSGTPSWKVQSASLI